MARRVSDGPLLDRERRGSLLRGNVQRVHHGILDEAASGVGTGTVATRHLVSLNELGMAVGKHHVGAAAVSHRATLSVHESIGILDPLHAEAGWIAGDFDVVIIAPVI